MFSTTSRGWKLALLFVVVAGIPASIFHASSGRWGNAVMAAVAVTAAIILYVTQPRDHAGPEARAVSRRRARPTQTGDDSYTSRFQIPPARSEVGARFNSAVLAGFFATVVTTLVLIPGYILAGMLAQEQGNQLQRWFYGLTENSVTAGVFDIPIGALAINLAAGLAWAFVYAFIVEPRLSGPGWRKGLLFAVAPWLLSLLVFFPAIGAGVLGVDLGAGPLPALGNLVLHAVYGLALGAMFAIPEVTPSEENLDAARTARWENDGIAIGLLLGLLVGAATGAALGIFVEHERFNDTNLLLGAAALGCALGGWLGAFAGLGVAQRRESH
ncbi:MAG: hypothetical protein DCC58_19630 [Chloroflexi bacterium]|nr:MAG: hypothetical protein DCC58_19630 [Chloroflexota bacterium]